MVIAIIAILAALLLPALSKAKVEAQRTQCMNNTHQLTLAWISYSHDFQDCLAINDNSDNSGGSSTGPTSWCDGILDWTTSPDNTNYALLTNPTRSLLGAYYAKTWKIFKCPADVYLSGPQYGDHFQERVRSVSMDAWLGAGDKYFTWAPAVKKMSDLRMPPPSMSWVFVDEDPDSINDAMLYLNPTFSFAEGQFGDIPASYHNQACGFSFADGHSEVHKWVNSHRWIMPCTYIEGPYDRASGLTDYAWMAQRTPGFPSPR